MKRHEKLVYPTNHAPKGAPLISPWLNPGVLRGGLINLFSGYMLFSVI
jgi:hypothetical protein